MSDTPIELVDLFVRADSITSEVGHRHGGSLPKGVRDDLLAISARFRALTDDRDELAVRVAGAMWPGRYAGDLSKAEWERVYRVLGSLFGGRDGV